MHFPAAREHKIILIICKYVCMYLMLLMLLSVQNAREYQPLVLCFMIISPEIGIPSETKTHDCN